MAAKIFSVLPAEGLPGMSGTSNVMLDLVDEVRRISEECLAEARRLLKQNRDKLDAIAKELLLHETLDEPAVYAAAGIARRARIEEVPVADRPRLP